jgi:hypothetical protein
VLGNEQGQAPPARHPEWRSRCSALMSLNVAVAGSLALCKLAGLLHPARGKARRRIRTGMVVLSGSDETHIGRESTTANCGIVCGLFG